MGLWITLRVAVWSVLACWGWDGRCALQSENYMNVCSVCAQDYTHRRRVTRVTNVREVFLQKLLELAADQRLERCRMRVVSSLT